MFEPAFAHAKDGVSMMEIAPVGLDIDSSKDVGRMRPSGGSVRNMNIPMDHGISVTSPKQSIQEIEKSFADYQSEKYGESGYKKRQVDKESMEDSIANSSVKVIDEEQWQKAYAS